MGTRPSKLYTSLWSHSFRKACLSANWIILSWIPSGHRGASLNSAKSHLWLGLLWLCVLGSSYLKWRTFYFPNSVTKAGKAGVSQYPRHLGKLGIHMNNVNLYLGASKMRGGITQETWYWTAGLQTVCGWSQSHCCEFVKSMGAFAFLRSSPKKGSPKVCPQALAGAKRLRAEEVGLI